MPVIIDKIKSFRQYQYFKLYAAMGVLILVLAAYFSLLNRSYLIITSPQKNMTIFVDGKKIDNAKISGQRHIIRLFPGTHTVKISTPETVEYAETVTLIRGLYKTINPALKLVPKIAEKSAGSVQFLTANQKKDQLYFLGNGGQTIYQLDIKTNHLAVLADNLAGIEELSFSPDFKLAFLKKSDGIYLLDFGRYDLISQEEKKLFDNNQATMPVWDPTAGLVQNYRRIAYFYQDSSSKTLRFTNQLNENPEIVYDLSQFDRPNLTWSPNGQKIVITSKNKMGIFDVFTRQLVNIDSFSNISSQVKFSPNSQFIAFTAASPKSDSPSNLFVLSSDTSQVRDLNQDTSIDKIAWTDKSDFLVLAKRDSNNNSDKFVKVDVRSGAETIYNYSSSDPIQATGIIFLKKDSSIYFQSHQRIYSLLLQPEG